MVYAESGMARGEIMVMSHMHFDKSKMPTRQQALPGRATPIATAEYHYVNGHSLRGDWQKPLRTVLLGMGCFWRTERLFWSLPGIYVTAVGYSGGYTPNPSYDEVCSGMTGHAEVVLIVYDHEKISLEEILRIFWEEHDPTQPMRQGSDIGTNYRSVIYVSYEEDYKIALKAAKAYEKALEKNSLGPIVTEIAMGQIFYYAEAYHQQYLAKNPGDCYGLQGTGVSCPVGLGIDGC